MTRRLYRQEEIDRERKKWLAIEKKERRSRLEERMLFLTWGGDPLQEGLTYLVYLQFCKEGFVEEIPRQRLEKVVKWLEGERIFPLYGLWDIPTNMIKC